MTLIGIYGAGGFGREMKPIIGRQYTRNGAQLVFIDDANQIERINGSPVLTYEAFLSRPEADKSVTITIANARVREKLTRQCVADGLTMLDVRAENVVLGDNCVVGEGAILCSFVYLTGDCRIGRSFHANYYSYVAHDCVIGNFVTFAPAVKCNGNVEIGDHAYIGAGAVIKQGLPGRPRRIGEGAIVGMGAVVVEDVAPGTIVVGNPARVLER